MAKKRVLVGGLHHESDTFNPIVTGRKDIFIRRDEELLNHKGQDSASGIIATLLDAGYEVIPTLVARAVPNGEWDYDYYQEIKKEFMDKVKAAGHIDAFCLAIHGSMRVKNLGEAEGDILEDLRKMYPDTPIITSLDMHATITKRMMDNADAFVGYKCAPHTDTYETGIHAAKMTIKCLEEGVKPVMTATHVPFIVAGEQSETSVEPMITLIKALRKLEAENEHVMAASYLLGFPWSDTEENGVHAIVVTDGDKELANKCSMELAQLFWSMRDNFHFYNETREPQDAIDATVQSIKDGVYPVVISDSGDNPTAGSSQDVTNFLKLIIKDGRLNKLDIPLVYQGIYDPEVVELAFQAGIGNKVKTTLGAKFDTVKSTPIEINATVKALHRNFQKAYSCDLALLDVEGVDVVVTSAHVGCYDVEMMEVLGIDPNKTKAIVVKLGYLEPDIRAVAKRSMMALTTGSSDEIFARLPYVKMKRPVYPLDGDFTPDLFQI